METIIEQQRRCHEERERLVDAMTQELLVKKTNLKEQINSDHRVHILLDRFTDVTGKILSFFFESEYSSPLHYKTLSVSRCFYND